MKLTKAHIKQIIKEELEKEDLEELNLPGSAHAKMQKAVEKELDVVTPSKSSEKEKDEEEEEEEDWTRDTKTIADKPAMVNIANLIKSKIDKKDEFIELITYFVETVVMDEDKELRLLRNLMSTLSANAKVAQEKKKEKDLPLTEIICEETLKILLKEIEAGRLNKADWKGTLKKGGDMLKKGIEKLTFKPTGEEKFDLTSDMEKIIKAFKRTKIEDLIRKLIDKPNEFSDIMLHMMSFVEEIPKDRQAQYFRSFINKWQEKLKQDPKKLAKSARKKKAQTAKDSIEKPAKDSKNTQIGFPAISPATTQKGIPTTPTKKTKTLGSPRPALRKGVGQTRKKRKK